MASTGGHLEQLVRISNQNEHRKDSTWVTFDNQQSRGLLNDRPTVHVDYVRPRDVIRAIKAALTVVPLLKSQKFDFCISTGAAIAAFILPLARLFGVRSIYIESVSRTAGPSLTGRLMARTPGVETFTQHSHWNLPRWTYAGTLLDNWEIAESKSYNGPLKIFVTLGTIKPYRFDRAVNAILKIVDNRDQITWQVGQTDRDDLPGEVFLELDSTHMAKYIAEADVVVTHAGVGSILNILDAGSAPVLAIRTKEHNEHIDDHQIQIAETMRTRNLALVLDLDIPDRKTLLSAGNRRVKLRTRTS
ncbi:glycosyltransferase [Rhodococcoides kyotonense]|uniref:glycosyltransferase n=1 Tax=Rhodococcoides kyotonense TaxID=398843 RepID=UPI0015958E78|nr:glycosyltransferase [Rhodococcus kyotonensis]